MYGLKTEASFDSAHFLTDYYGKCENLHGHRWRAVVYLEVADLQADGTMKDMVVDFGAWKRARWPRRRWPPSRPRASA